MNPLKAYSGNARVLRCTDAEYHADPCEVPSLSHSIAHTLVSQSPAHAWAAHPKLGGATHEPTDAQIDGSILHRLILGAGPDIVVIDADSYRTKASQQSRDEAIAADKIPVLQHKYMQHALAASILIKRCNDLGFTFNGISEAAIQWKDEGVVCRCKIDHATLKDERLRVIDIKKLYNPHPSNIAKLIYDYGYDIQQAAYSRAITALMQDREGSPDIDFVFLVLEPTAPYSVVPVRLDSTYQRIGEARWERARGLWAGCLASGQWPGYQEAVVHPPGWVINSDEWGESYGAQKG